METTKTPKLFSHQLPHVDNIASILNHEFGCLDTSEPGCGKTFTALEIAKRFSFDILVICPKTASEIWMVTAKKFGITLGPMNCVTYGSLSGKVGKGCNNGLLVRYDDEDTGEVTFKANNLYLEWLNEGRKLVIVDEMQNCKNDSSRTRAVVALTSALFLHKKKTSRVLCLSAAPTDRAEPTRIVNLFRILGVIKSESLYEYDRQTGLYNLTGLAELIDVAKRVDEKGVDSLYKNLTVDKKTAGSKAIEIYHRWIKGRITTSMAPMDEIKRRQGISPPDRKDGFYNILDKDDWLTFNEGKEMVESILDRSGKTYTFNERFTLVAFTKGMKLMEAGMIGTMARVARKYLEERPRCKVALYVEYIGNEKEPGAVLRLLELLSDYNPLALRANESLTPIPYAEGLSKSSRQRKIDAFQDPDFKHRVLITGATCGGVSVSLDAQSEDEERVALLIPSTRFMDQLQSVGRFWRANTKTPPIIRFMYAKGYDELPAILSSIINKNSNAKKFLANPEGVTLPGEYEKEYEPDIET